MSSFHPLVAIARYALRSAIVAVLALAPPAHAGDPSLPGEILLRLTSSDVLAPLLRKHGLVQLDRFGTRPIFRVGVIGARSVGSTIDALRFEPGVIDAEPNFTHAAPEARKNNAWAIGSPAAYAAQWMPDAIHLADAQRLSVGAGMRVAVLDTGVDGTHPSLRGRLLPGFDFVDGDPDPAEVSSPLGTAYGHGTHVAGIVALVAPAARIMPLRVLDADGRGNAWVLAEAVLYAVDPDNNPATDDGAHVINLSLGSLSRTRLMDAIARLAACVLDQPEAAGPNEFADAGYDDDRQRCRASNGAVIVAAAGNDASAAVKEYPAAEGAYGLISVTASTAAMRLAGFSNFGSWIAVAAPGEDITSAVPGGQYGTWSGTSMAAPVVAGVAALARANDPVAIPDRIVKRLRQYTSRLCGTRLRSVDALGVVTNAPPPDPICR